MTTPIDTTRLRALLDAAEKAAPGEWDAGKYGIQALTRNAAGEIEKYTDVVSWDYGWDHADECALKPFIAAMDPTTVRALLDEVEGLRARLDEAYPRALQAAAGVVFRYDLSSAVLDMEDEDDVAAAMDALADDILELSAEQIEACDAKVERDHAAAVAPKTERPVVIWHYRNDEEELPSCDDVDEAIYNAIHAAGWGMCGKLERPGMLEETVTVYGFARMQPTVLAWRYLEQVLEDLDEEHSDGSATKASQAMIEAADMFASVIEREYVSWACEAVETRVVNVREWCAAHRPDWLAQLPAIESEEGGEHG